MQVVCRSSIRAAERCHTRLYSRRPNARDRRKITRAVMDRYDFHCLRDLLRNQVCSLNSAARRSLRLRLLLWPNIGISLSVLRNENTVGVSPERIAKSQVRVRPYPLYVGKNLLCSRAGCCSFEIDLGLKRYRDRVYGSTALSTLNFRDFRCSGIQARTWSIQMARQMYSLLACFEITAVSCG